MAEPGDVGRALTRKWHGAPIWLWGVGIGAALALLYWLLSRGTASQGAPQPKQTVVPLYTAVPSSPSAAAPAVPATPAPTGQYTYNLTFNGLPTVPTSQPSAPPPPSSPGQTPSTTPPAQPPIARPSKVVTIAGAPTAVTGAAVTYSALATGFQQPVFQWWVRNPSGQWQGGSWGPDSTYTRTFDQPGTWVLQVYAREATAPSGVQSLKTPSAPFTVSVTGAANIRPPTPAPSSAPPSGTPRPAATTYTVRPGDSLWAIAQRFYGNGALWPRIYAANRGVIGANPNLIYPGERLVIPA